VSRPGIEPRNEYFGVPTGCSDLEGNTTTHDMASDSGPHVVLDPEHAHDPPRQGTGRSQARPSKMDRRDAREKAEAKYQKMNGPGKSDRLVVSGKLPNKADEAAEAVERSGLTKGNANQHNTRRTLSRESVPSALERIRIAAKGDKGRRFTSLFHHINSVERLRDAFLALRRDASAGIDGETWDHYAENLDDNLKGLSERLKRGAYRAKPVRRVFIPKADGKRRPLGIPSLEDKVVQKATAEVLNAIYEQDFAGFSYGFRPGRNQHQALKALGLAMERNVNWVIDADIRGFFDAIDHEWLIKFVNHRIGDPRVVRLIQKWLAAGVMENGEWKSSEKGTPQGGIVSPILANLYLHYAFDLWTQWWRKQPGRKNVIVVRYADDFITGFQQKLDAYVFLRHLKERLAKFGLELHPEKTRLLEFGRFAISSRLERKKKKPETFNFLGFTHICKMTKSGKCVIERQTERKRATAKLRAIRQELRKRMHQPIPEVGKWLGAVLRGHYQYYGISFNSRAISSFRYHVTLAWHSILRRRSQKGYVTWERMTRLQSKWLPPARLAHPNFLERNTADPR
jgi:RNA-directed DNA polymerase